MAELEITLHRQQARALRCPATEILFGGAAGGGKALVINELLPTASGWTTMGAVRPGDQLFDENGHPCRVTQVFDVDPEPELYRLTFDDGTTIDACVDHQWLTFDTSELAALTRLDPEWRERRRAKRSSRAEVKAGHQSGHSDQHRAFLRETITRRNQQRKYCYKKAPTGTVRTTAQIVATLRTKTGRANHAIPVTKAIQPPTDGFPFLVDPYCLGAWLGDGSKSGGSFAGIDPEIWHQFQINGYKVTHSKNAQCVHHIHGLVMGLRAIGVLNNKHVPARYLRASRADRLALLQGLMDTDGTVTDNGSAEFTNTNRQLAEAVYELIVGLGWKTNLIEGRATLDGRDCGPKYDLKFTPDVPVFRLRRKAERQRLASRRTTRFRYIIDAKRIASEPARCISVDSPSRLFLAGRSMIPTHNSHLLRAALIAYCTSVPGLQCYLFRRTYPDLVRNHLTGPGAFPQMLSSLTADGRVVIVKGEVRFWNGSCIHLRHLQHFKDVYSYQGAEFHVLCCEENERIRMSDGSTRPINRLKVGDMVATLQGPRRVTAVNPRRRQQCVTATVFDADGNLLGEQTHGVTHSLLTPSGWLSFDTSDELRQPWIFSPTESRFFRKSGERLNYSSSPEKQSLDNHRPDQPPSGQPKRSQAGRQLQSATSDEMVQESQGSGSGSSGHEAQGPPPLSSGRRVRVVLASRWLPSTQEGQRQHGFQRDESPDVGTSKPPEGCNADYHAESGCDDAHPPLGSGNVSMFAPSQGDVEERIPSDSLLDDEAIIRERSRSGRSYEHPYTGEIVQAEEASELGECFLVSCGERWTIDITIEDANHYVTECGLVNKNCFDEATHFLETEYTYLRGRCRLGGLPIPADCEWTFPRILMGSNPGNIGHQWVKDGWVKFGPYLIHRAAKSDGGMLRCFIPSRIEDNPTLMLNDPTYIDRLEGLGDPALVRAMREGDWDVVAGAMFGDVWRNHLHVCDPFPIPQDWDIWVGADDGYHDPCVFTWLTQDPNTGTFYAIAEWHHSGKLPGKVADGVKEVQAEIVRAPRSRGGKTELDRGPVVGLMDSASFADSGQAEISRGDQMRRLGLKIKPVDKWPGSRKDRAQNLHRLLGVNPRCPQKMPGLRVFRGHCPNLIKTIPTLPRDEKKPEQVADCAFDHNFDSISYGLQYKISRVSRKDVGGL